MSRSDLMRGGLIAALVALVGLLPLAINDFQKTQFAFVAVYVIAIAGLNIVTGYAGQVSLGHGAAVSIGAYTTAILAGQHGVPYYATIPVAAAVAGLGGLALGLPALRLSGLYLALVTFGVAVSTPAIAKHFTKFTGGSTGQGFTIVKPPGNLVTENEWLYYFSWAFALAALAVAWLLVRGRLGRAFRAVRDSEVAATSSGIDLSVYKLVAFAISAAFAGVAGSLFAIDNLSYVSPDAPDPIKLSIYLLVGAVVAGLGSLRGIVIGALLIEFLYTGDLEKWLHLPKSVPADFFFGAVLVVVIVLVPRGAAGLLSRLAGLGRLYPYHSKAGTPPERGVSTE